MFEAEVFMPKGSADTLNVQPKIKTEEQLMQPTQSIEEEQEQQSDSDQEEEVYPGSNS